MSQAGRQDLTGRIISSAKPDSQKTTTEQAGDFIKGKADSVASTAQPQSQKTATQKMGDTVGHSNENDQSLMDKAKEAVGLGDTNKPAH